MRRRMHLSAVFEEGETMACLRTTTKLRAVMMAYALMSSPTSATVVTATETTLSAVFNRAVGGDTIKLLGNFDRAYLANRNFDRIVSLDASQATFSGTLTIENIQRVALNGGTFNIGANGSYAKGVAVYGGAHVYLDNLTIYGSANGLINQFGIAASSTYNLQVTHSRFNGLASGIAVGGLGGGFLAANNFIGSTSDGIDISDSHGTLATGNVCSGGHPGPSAHPDCIQLWSVPGHPLESDITVTNNRAYGPTAGFTDFDAGLRIKLSGNIVESSFIHGVSCYDCINSTITNNKVSTLAGSPYQTQVIVSRGSGNIVSGNIITPYIPQSNKQALKSDPVVDLFSHRALDTVEFSTANDWLVYPTEGTLTAVPEPSTWVLYVVGLCAAGIARRRAIRGSATVVA